MQFSENALHVSLHDVQLAEGMIRCFERDNCFDKQSPAYSEQYGGRLDYTQQRALLVRETDWSGLYIIAVLDLLATSDR